MTRNKKIIGAVIAVIALSSFIFGGEEKPIKVLSVKPEIRNVEKTVSNTRAGTIDACRRSKMSPAAAGQISVLHVKEGDSVKEGDILLELWNKETKARVTASERSSEQACIVSAKAERDASRANELYEKGIFALPIVYPMVAKDKARIRCMISSGLTKSDLDVVISTFANVGKKLGII